jgi:hypothetical protein
MDPNRKLWNEQQQALRQALTHAAEHHRAIDLFLNQHAMVHSSAVSASGLWSFEDEVWQDLDDEAARILPRGLEHSVAWMMWHIARIEDVTMNMLLAGEPQLLYQEGWYERMQVKACDTGNAMPESEIAVLSATINLSALKAYREAVGRQTRVRVKQLKPEAFKNPVDAERLQQVFAEGAVVEAARGLLDYWGGLTIARLLLMPPTRHNLVHLNEALRVKQKVLKAR